MEFIYHTGDEVLIKGDFWIKAKYDCYSEMENWHQCIYNQNGFDWITKITDDNILPYKEYKHYEYFRMSKEQILERNNKHIPIQINQEVLFKTCSDDINKYGIWCKGIVKNIGIINYTIIFWFMTQMNEEEHVDTTGVCKVIELIENVFPYTKCLEGAFLHTTETVESVRDYWYKYCHQKYLDDLTVTNRKKNQKEL